MIEIEKTIPHRPPFLLVDEVTELTETAITATTTLRADDELFARVYAGHYPGSPITPGVLLCEMVFQAAGILVGQNLGDADGRVPVLTRIRDARFKTMVAPGETVTITAELEDTVSNAYYMKGTVKVNGALAVRVSFACALVEAEG